MQQQTKQFTGIDSDNSRFDFEFGRKDDDIFQSPLFKDFGIEEESKKDKDNILETELIEDSKPEKDSSKKETVSVNTDTATARAYSVTGSAVQSDRQCEYGRQRQRAIRRLLSACTRKRSNDDLCTTGIPAI